MGVILVMQCLVTAGSVTKCDNLHCGLWKIFGWCVPFEAECQNFYFWYSQSLLSGILIDSGSCSPDIKNHYKRFRAHVQKAIRDAYWKHISNIFSFENDDNDPDCPRKNEKCKMFWSFVKSLKKEASGITSLRENGILKTWWPWCIRKVINMMQLITDRCR